MTLEHIWAEAIPDRLYKYMRRQHADELLRTGRLLLSGLESYPLIDEEEGTLTCEIDSLGHSEMLGSGTTADVIKTNLRGVTQVAESARGTRFENCQVLRGTGNAIVFCTSTMCSRATMHACNSEYDTCVEICDVQSFIEYLGSYIRMQAVAPFRCLVGNCKYQRREHSVREVPPFDGFAVAFVKPLRFEPEREFRILWTATLPPGQPLTVDCPELASCCGIRDIVD